MPAQTSKPGLRERIACRELMRGSFVKSTDPSSIEIFGAAGLDFVVIDQEHGAVPSLRRSPRPSPWTHSFGPSTNI
jgi:2-keto-3-deoxy-L-rhamnonate aldolase RhmA